MFVFNHLHSSGDLPTRKWTGDGQILWWKLSYHLRWLQHPRRRPEWTIRTPEDGPACQQYNEELLLPFEAAAIHPTAHNGSHEDIGPFPRNKSRGLHCNSILHGATWLRVKCCCSSSVVQRSYERCTTELLQQQYKRCTAKVAIRSQCGGQADHKHKEIWPHHACAQGSA